MRKKIIGIYKITSPTGKIYIGQSIDVLKRLKRHIKDSKTVNIKLYRSLLKYGVYNHMYDIIEECEVEQLNERERYWQEYYNCVDNGLNCLYTSTKEKKTVFSKETKDKISQSGIGRVFSDSHKQKISKALKRYKKTEEHANKIAIKNKGRKCSKETRELLSSIRKRGDNSRAKIVLNLETGIYYDCAKDVAEMINKPYPTVKTWLGNNNVKNPTNFIYA